MNINAQISFTTEPKEIVRADAFVKPIYRPNDDDTEQGIIDLLKRLELPTNPKHVCAMASVVVAVKKADAKGSNRIAYPGGSADYTKGLYARRIAVTVRDRLIEKGHLKAISKQRRGQAIVYEATGFDLTGEYTSADTLLVRVRKSKTPWEQKGKSIPRKSCVKKFRSKYTEQEKRIGKLNETYAAHPLTSSGGFGWGAAFRGFNESRLDRGGRLYGDWQQFKETDRLKFTIDGERLVEIDIVASFLFIVSAEGGSPIPGKDPYSDIDWVKDPHLRDLAKVLVNAIISTDGPLGSFPRRLRRKFAIPQKVHLNDYQDPILRTYPQLKSPAVSGMEAMFLESEAVISTIEVLITKGVVAYPVHDCLLVAEKHKDIAVDELWRQMEDRFGAKPWLKVTYGDGREERLDPSKRPSAGKS